MSKVKSCLLCENYNTHPCKCEHCEDWDNFHISESGKALREKIYGDGYQDGHKDGYDKGYEDAQANNNRPQGEWIEKVERRGCFADDKTVYSYTCPFCGAKEFKKYPFCHCGADLRKGGAEE